MKMATGEGRPAGSSAQRTDRGAATDCAEDAVSDHVFEYARQLVRVTRVTTDEALPMCKKCSGCGSTAGLNLIMAAKAHAMLEGQVHVGTENVPWPRRCCDIVSFPTSQPPAKA